MFKKKKYFLITYFLLDVEGTFQTVVIAKDKLMAEKIFDLHLHHKMHLRGHALSVEKIECLK